jgi:phosphatidate cytidylyltransferase
VSTQFDANAPAQPLLFTSSDRLRDRIFTGLALSLIIGVTLTLSPPLFQLFLAACAATAAGEHSRLLAWKDSRQVREEISWLRLNSGIVAFWLVIASSWRPAYCWLWLWPWMLAYFKPSVGNITAARSNRAVIITSAWSHAGPLGLLAALAAMPGGRLLTVGYAVMLASSDTGGFALGKTLGQHAWLGPGLGRWLMHNPVAASPKKSIAGFIGSLAVPAGVAYLLAHHGALPLRPIPAAIMGLVLGLLGQIGDIRASTLKRAAGFKDFAVKMFGLLPGMGGVGDRTDSVQTTTPWYVLVLALTGHTQFWAPSLDLIWRFM